jgi:hypothetical protein
LSSDVMEKFVLESIKLNTNEAIKIYQADRNYPKFYRNFLKNSDNGGLLVEF